MITTLTAKGPVRRETRGHPFWRWLALAAGCGLPALTAAAQTFNVLYTFSGTPSVGDGGNPAGLMQGTNGYFYVSGVNEGTDQFGAICQLSASGAMKPVYSFKYSPITCDGANPYAALVQGTNGLFYGATQSGGTNGYGAIFNVSSNGTLNSLYSFTRERSAQLTNADGAAPSYALVLGTNRNLYGTAPEGGTNGYGTVFQITHQGKITVFYSFSNTVDGGTPLAPLMQFTNGNLYGTAAGGGSNGYGTVFQVTAAGHVTSIYSFTNGIDGATPEGALINGEDGQLYGTCSVGGSNGTGTIFTITTAGVLTPLYSFSAGTNYPGTSGVENQYNSDGINPKTILFGNDNNIYGVAFYGGLNGAGSIFECTKAGALTVLHAFDYVYDDANTDGANPISLLRGPAAILFGTAYNGGSNGFGAFFTIGLPPSITRQPANQAVALHGNAAFSVSATNALACQWQLDGGNVPDATNWTLSITNVQLADAGSYQAVLTNLNGATTSAFATLAITNLPVYFLTNAGALQYGAGQFCLQLTNFAGQGAVVIQASDDLLQWTPVCTNTAGFGGAQIMDGTAGSHPSRFYRALAP
jgi:uncharacterized repeat protein (TIGR03803 family)